VSAVDGLLFFLVISIPPNFSWVPEGVDWSGYPVGWKGMMKRWPNRKPTDQMKGVCFLVFPLQNYLSLYIFNRRYYCFSCVYSS